MTLVQRSARPRSMMKVTARTDSSTRATRNSISIFVWPGIGSGASVIIECEQHVPIIFCNGPAHVTGPGGVRVGIHDGALAEQPEHFADVVAIHLEVGNTSIIVKAEFE